MGSRIATDINKIEVHNLINRASRHPVTKHDELNWRALRKRHSAL